MVTSTMQLTGFVGEMNRDTVLSHYEHLVDNGLEQDEAITQSVEAIIYSRRADDFVREFATYVIKGGLASRESYRHPAGAPRTWSDKPKPLHPVVVDPDEDGGLEIPDTHDLAAAPSSPEPTVQGFPEPGKGRRINIPTLQKQRVLEGVLGGVWKVDGASIPLGLLTAEQCFKLADSEMKAGRTRVANGTMFRRLGESLSPGEVVADRWDDERVNILFESSEAKI